MKARITKLFRPRFSKTLVLVKSRVLKYGPRLNIIGGITELSRPGFSKTLISLSIKLGFKIQNWV